MIDEDPSFEVRDGVVSYLATLPPSAMVSTQTLSACFQNVTNSYKFYWFLSLLEEYTQHNDPIIKINDILARMLSQVWYPVTYFRLNFGKLDQLSTIVSELRSIVDIKDETNTKEIRECLQELLSGTAYPTQQKMVMSLRRFVPTRFLVPWFSNSLKGAKDHEKDKKIRELADASFSASLAAVPLYRFVEKNQSIELHPDWRGYLGSQVAILKGFCLWKLLRYLQKRNPNTPGISEKLFPPQQRELKVAKDFWSVVFAKRRDPLTCLYSGQLLTSDNSSIDHFLPWSYVVHDLLWNLVPVLKSANSSKSNRLPHIDTYFHEFASIQYEAIQIVGSSDKKKLLEDYILLTKADGSQGLLDMEAGRFSAHLKDAILPQLQIARNMGFESDWNYTLSA